jgi:hypothetical protein
MSLRVYNITGVAIIISVLVTLLGHILRPLETDAIPTTCPS